MRIYPTGLQGGYQTHVRMGCGEPEEDRASFVDRPRRASQGRNLAIRVVSNEFLALCFQRDMDRDPFELIFEL